MTTSKKCDFKKLALLGITGGTMLATQAVEAEINNFSELLALNACGGQSGCRGNQGMGGSSGSYQAYRNIPNQDAYYYTNGQQQYSSCGGASPQYYQSTSGCGGASPQYYQQSSGYSAPQYYQPSYSQPSYSQPGYSQHHNQPSSGCASSAPQSYQAYSQPTQGCGAASSSSGQIISQPQQPAMNTPASSSAANQNSTYTQWETGYTADNAKSMTQGKSSMQQDAGSSMQQDKGSKKMMTESELLSQLNEEGKKTYNSLDANGKALALRMASQDSFKDKNLAVKAAALKMSEKRMAPASSK